MRVSIRKTVVAAIAALGMAAAVATISTPAEAQWRTAAAAFMAAASTAEAGAAAASRRRRRGGWHGGGGWGGGWHGGGWRGAAGAAAGVVGAPAGAGVGGWGGGCWNCGWGWGGWGCGSGLGDRSRDRARRGRDRLRSPAYGGHRLLGQTPRLDGERPLSRPATCEHLHVNLVRLWRAELGLQVNRDRTITTLTAARPECLFSIYCDSDRHSRIST